MPFLKINMRHWRPPLRIQQEVLFLQTVGLPKASVDCHLLLVQAADLNKSHLSSFIYFFFSVFLQVWFSFTLAVFHSDPVGPVGILLRGGGGDLPNVRFSSMVGAGFEPTSCTS